MPDEPFLTAADVGMTFANRQRTLDGIQLNVARGEFVTIVGPSGCGKSTLLRMVAGLIAPTEGALRIDGRAPSERTADQHTAFVFQEPRLLPWRNVVDNIRLPLELHGRPRDEQQAAIRQSLDLIGLTEEDGQKRPAMLSGGMRMRVSLARALVTQPEILLLDEPFAALDDLLRQQLNEDLLRLWAARKWTALFVTHNVSEAVFLGQRVLVMSRSPGRILAEIPVPFDGRREPSLRAEPEFARLTGVVSMRLREAAAR